MVSSIVLDIVALVLIVLAVLEGRRKGFVKMLWKVAAWILTLILVMVLIKPVTDWAMTTDNVQGIVTNITETVENSLVKSNIDVFTPEAISEATNIPAAFIPAQTVAQMGEDFTAAALSLAGTVALTVIKIAVGLILFILIRILLSIAFRILNLVAKLPIINGVNKLFGMAMGFINIMFILYIVLGIATLYIEPQSQWDIVINNTYLVKNLYNNNILLSLIS